MGFFSLKNFINPLGASSGNKLISQIADPMDIFGNRAADDQNEMNKLNQQSADAAMKELQESYDKIKTLYQPLEDAGKQGLAQLNSAGFTPSQTYEQTLATGGRDLGRQLRAMGRYRSTFGARQMGDFYNRAAQEEVDRQYAPTLSLIQTGSGAVNAITGAGTTFGGATDRTLANLGQGLAGNSTLYGQQRQNSLNSLGNALGGAASYFAAKG